MNFGQAIEAMKDGAPVRRGGWNGKGMWIAYSPGNPALPATSFWSKAAAYFAASRPGGSAEVLPCIVMKTADDKILVGWLASQSDMLAEDWELA